jgi:hypothetical protein
MKPVLAKLLKDQKISKFQHLHSVQTKHMTIKMLVKYKILPQEASVNSDKGIMVDSKEIAQKHANKSPLELNKLKALSEFKQQNEFKGLQVKNQDQLLHKIKEHRELSLVKIMLLRLLNEVVEMKADQPGFNKHKNS